jgi:hypothetical protein
MRRSKKGRIFEDLGRILGGKSMMMHALTWSMYSKMLYPKEIIGNCLNINCPS